MVEQLNAKILLIEFAFDQIKTKNLYQSRGLTFGSIPDLVNCVNGDIVLVSDTELRYMLDDKFVCTFDNENDPSFSHVYTIEEATKLGFLSNQKETGQ